MEKKPQKKIVKGKKLRLGKRDKFLKEEKLITL